MHRDGHHGGYFHNIDETKGTVELTKELATMRGKCGGAGRVQPTEKLVCICIKGVMERSTKCVGKKGFLYEKTYRRRVGLGLVVAGAEEGQGKQVGLEDGERSVVGGQ